MTSAIKTIRPVTHGITTSRSYNLWGDEDGNITPHRKLKIGFDMVGNPLRNGKVLGKLEIKSMPYSASDSPYLGMAWTGGDHLNCHIIYEAPDKVEAIEAALDFAQRQKFELSLLWREENGNWAITGLKFGDVAFP